MRLLIVNPNTSDSVTRLIEAEARRVARPQTVITARTAGFGVPYIETAPEAAVAGYAVLDMIAREQATADAAIIAAFGDPGLAAAKAAFAIPVIGLSEAAFLMAAALGESFGIVSISPRMRTWYRRAVDQQHMGPRFRGFRFLRPPIADIASVQDDRGEELLALGAELAEEGAGTVLFAGAPLAGFVRAKAGQLTFAAIDGTSAAVHLAEAAVGMRTSDAASPPMGGRQGKTTTGLPDHLAQLF